MCGLSGIVGPTWEQAQLEAMVAIQQHRGPDDTGLYIDSLRTAGLGHNRLSIIDLSRAGHQPMHTPDGSKWIIFNGEIYNYRELREELSDYPFRSETDTEVILAAYDRWGECCLDRFVGMFAFLIWDSRTQRLFAARDRFGVKPLYYYAGADGTLFLSSEIKALHAAGVSKRADVMTWATYFKYGLYDHSEKTFWHDVRCLLPGHAMDWQAGRNRVWCWYDLSEHVGEELDSRPIELVQEEYLALLLESTRLRFRSDVPLGVNVSGGLDSAILLGLVQPAQGKDTAVKAFTCITGDPRYDELPWVEQLIRRTHHSLVICSLKCNDVPDLAYSVQRYQDEPFGGLPTLAYARLFEQARQEGVTVLLEGQGMDEQWAGYDYYGRFLSTAKSSAEAVVGSMQGSNDKPVRPECLVPEFYSQAPPFEEPSLFPDALRNRQYVDTCFSKIPRAVRFNDRVSMRCSRELREPFLDHRLFELALRQPPERKIANGTHKKLLRELVRRIVPAELVEAPKRAVQTPQREWLRGDLRDWAQSCIESTLSGYGDVWLDKKSVRRSWKAYCAGASDNSFYVWQWINLALWMECASTEPVRLNGQLVIPVR
jgi:asparagine synthase (glutamine-hydrolysing)